LVASAKLHGTTFAPDDPSVLETFVEVLDQRPSFAVIALNAPIGYLQEFQKGGRTCDREARVLVGRRGAAIQSAPIRSQVEDANSDKRAGLNAITRQLMPRYLEVAAEMAPYRQRTVYEVTSELSFYQLNEDEPLRWPKQSELGYEERRVLIDAKIPDAERIYEAKLQRVPRSHLLDVAAFLWTARRVFARAALRMPQDPEWDEHGLRMEYVR
jgi:predicted RNase H-like nuclease